MFVTELDYNDWQEEEGSLILDWMLQENGVSIEKRYDILTA